MTVGASLLHSRTQTPETISLFIVDKLKTGLPRISTGAIQSLLRLDMHRLTDEKKFTILQLLVSVCPNISARNVLMTNVYDLVLGLSLSYLTSDPKGPNCGQAPTTDNTSAATKDRFIYLSSIDDEWRLRFHFHDVERPYALSSQDFIHCSIAITNIYKTDTTSNGIIIQHNNANLRTNFALSSTTIGIPHDDCC